ncbi:flagellar assembly protein T N-terminal domain-containing protein [Selenomonas ruminis]|uniref:Flagellar assembly protein T N-terminal domain-containing protein n=1 Tax=Selenomonas ruminis TaxID=2593411 RepID=A0A5D6WCR6_9FIRM|nr:flagellar assembly protein T N-terminal domain-containing protein [Selenomonas sp. mPRGC5]TYZ24618.1 hypothetical protein FZ040_00805 [Selenomonas sp. mPRGC5]
MWRKLVVLSGLLLLPPLTVSAAVVTVTGQGGSERSALRQALRQAVEQQVGVMVDSRSYVQNYRLINDRIYTQADGFIKNYEVLSSNKENGICTVKIRADVAEQKLSAALGSYAQKKAVVGANLQDPRVGVVAMDKQGERYASLENAVMEGLSTQGYTRIIDIDQLDQSKQKQLQAAAFAGDKSMIKSLTCQFPLDYLVMVSVNKAVGSMADYASVPGFENLKKAIVIVSVRMLNVNNGEVIYAGVFTGKSERRGPNAVNEAIADAAKGIPEAVGTAALNKAANPEQHLQLIITENKWGNISEATETLRELAGVRNVFVRSSSFGNMTVDIDFNGTAHDFATVLEGNGWKVLALGAEYIKI